MTKRILATSLLFVLAFAPVGAQPESGKEELKLKLPKPMFIGTPTNLKSANLEVVTGKPRPAFYVPKGTVLVSTKKTVTSSDMQPVIGELDMVTDGEKAGGDGFFIELGPGPQWVQVDLGAPQALHAILAWHYHSQARIYRDVIVQVSNDAAFKTGVTTVFNNDHDNSSKIAPGKDKEYIEVAEGKLFDPKGATGRYVRLYSNGNTTNDLNHYVEVEVYGHTREMTRAGVVAVLAIALTAALALRLARLDVRPMHHDEANQAVKFGTLLERGEYRYDAHDHHGPTLYYLSLPAAWLRGQFTLAALDERTLRGVTAMFGTATILLLALLSDGIGRTAVAAAAILMALSPAMVFYSRMFIQESLFACFTLAFVIAVGRVTLGGGLVWSTLAGIAAGLAVATKETSAIVLPAALAAGAIAWWSLGPGRPNQPFAGGRWRVSALVSLGVAAAIAALFYSSFLASPEGVLEPFRGVGTYLGRGIDPADHGHPWHYYVGLLAYVSSGGVRWSEGLALMLAIAGGVTAWGGDRSRPDRSFWARYLTVYVVIAAAIFSAIPYKTPWNLLPFYSGVLVLAGIGFSRVVHATSPPALRGALVAAFVLAAANLGWQAWRASVTYAADSRNPYVYAQTVPDTVRMAARIRELSARHPDAGRMRVSVVAAPYEQWPLPWYLRAMPHVGYWTEPADPVALQAPVIVASMEHTAGLDARLGDRYVSEFYGLRPEVLLGLYVERGLWERFLARAALDRSRPSCGHATALSRHCGHTPAVTLWPAAILP